MYEKVKKRETVEDLFQLLEIEKAWRIIKQDRLKQIKVAYLGPPYDASRSKGKKVNITQYPGPHKHTTEHITGTSTLFVDILSRYCYPADYLGPKLLVLSIEKNFPAGNGAVIEQVKRAIKEQVDVLCISYCNVNFDAELARYLHKAAMKNIIVIASAGNFIFEEYTFPACLDTVLACSSLDINGQPTLFANINEYVDICAYEENILPYLDNVSYKEWSRYADPLTHFLVTGSKPTMNMLFNTLIKNQLFGTSYSLPLTVALVALAKSLSPQLNIKSLKRLFEKALTAFITYKTKQKEKRIGKINFLEVLEYLASHKNSIHSDSEPEADFGQQFLLQVTAGGTDSASPVLTGEVFDSKGTTVEYPDTTLRYVIYPFNKYSEKPGYYYIQEGRLTLKNGRFNWNYGFLPRGEYFIKIIDMQGNILNALIKIKKE